jgi:thymidylate kinase
VSEVVPEHSIARLDGGFITKAQVWRFQLNSDLTIFDMFDTETIGYKTKQSVGLRVLDGIQFHAKPDFTFYLDPAHHFGLDITYENGRTAPNFEYLNTVNAGLKVVY